LNLTYITRRTSSYLLAWCILYTTLIALTIVEIVLCVRKKLSSHAYLWLNVIKTGLSVGAFVVTIIGALILGSASQGRANDFVSFLEGVAIWTAVFVFMQ
jgi:hypothetical protein